jgi:hypothetical protein
VRHERSKLGVAARAAEAVGISNQRLEPLRAGLELELYGGLEVEAGEVFGVAVVQVVDGGIVSVIVGLRAEC